MKQFSIGFVIVLLLFLSVVGYQYSVFHDGKLHIVFCDVGQGDAILIRTPKGKTVLYDGGPDEKVLNCLANNLPFWHRRIDLMLLSHPHADHLNGLITVLDRYIVTSFGSEELVNKTAAFAVLKEHLASSHIPQRTLTAGDTYRTEEGVALRILGPTQRFLSTTSPNGIIGEKGEFASVIAHLQYESFDLLLTGDSQVSGLQDILLDRSISFDVIQVPHHGSKTGLDVPLLKQLKPQLALISVGKNRYGHPSPITLSLLSNNNIPIRRTDQDHTVEVVSDGDDWWLKNN